MTTNKSALSNILIGLLGMVGGIVASFLTMTATLESASVEREQALYERIKVLEDQVAFLTQEMIKKDLALSKRYNNTEIFKRSLDRIPFPIAVKLIVEDEGADPDIVNWYINNEYRSRYQVSKEHYYGKKDSEIWPKQIADHFREFDLWVMKYRAGRCDYETYQKFALRPPGQDNPKYRGLVCKWFDEVEGAPAILLAVVTEQQIQ